MSAVQNAHSMALLSSKALVSSPLRSGTGPAQPVTRPASLTKSWSPNFMHCLEDFPNPFKWQQLRSWCKQLDCFLELCLTLQAEYQWCLGAGMRRYLRLPFVSMNRFLSLSHAEVRMIFEHLYCYSPIPPALQLLMVGKVILECEDDDTSEAGDPFLQGLENDRNFLV